MKTLKLIAITTFVIVFLQSCEKVGEIEVRNNISKVTITDVQWGGYSISYKLLPGETSSKQEINGNDLPAQHKVTFRMTANSKSIYLETVEKYNLGAEDHLVIVLDDKTAVRNPNE